MSFAADLKRAFGLSLAIHLAAGFLFQVRIESGISVFRHESTRLSFLGAILDHPSVNVVPLGEFKSVKTIRAWYPRDVLTPSPVVSPEEDRLPDVSAALGQKLPSLKPSEDPSVGAKNIVHSTPRQFLLVEKREIPFLTIEGPLEERGILFKPDLPEYLKSQRRDIPDRMNMVLRFRVSKEGIVEQVEPVRSSGNEELDLYGMRFLRQWKFIPSEVSQESLLKVHFTKEMT